MNKIELRKIDSIIFLMLLIIPLVVIPIKGDIFYLPKLIGIYLLFSIILTKWLLYENKVFALDIGVSNQLLTCYLVLLTISTISSSNFFLSLWGEIGREEGYLTLVLYILLFLFSSRYCEINESRIAAFVFVATVISIITVFQYFLFNPLKFIYPFLQFTSPVNGTIGNQNFLGSYFVIMLPLAIWIYMKKPKIYNLIMSCTIYFALLLTMTRGAWVGAFFAFIMLLLVIDRKSIESVNFFTTTISFLLITLLFNEISNGYLFGRILTIAQDAGATVGLVSGYSTASGFQRIFIWEKVISLILQKPFLGWGPDTLGLVFTDRFHNLIVEKVGYLLIIDKAHNEYLQIAYASGIPSLLLYLAFIVSVLSKAWKKHQKNPIIIPLFCSVIGYLVQAFFNISVVSVAYIFWIFLGALIYMANHDYINNGL